MRTDFENQLEPCVRIGVCMPPSPAAEGNTSPLIPGPICDNSAPGCVLEHKTETSFLKELIAIDNSEANLQLRDSLAKADRENRFIVRAIILMVTLFIVSLAGLSYCALLVPQVFYNSTHLATKSLSVLGLASLIAQLEFFGYLFWHRFAVIRLHKECRHRALLLVQSRLRASLHLHRVGDSGRESGFTSASTTVQPPEQRLYKDRYERVAPDACRALKNSQET